MKKWSFHLEPVRQHRLKREEEAAANYGRELNALSAASEKVRVLREELLKPGSFRAGQGASSVELLKAHDFRRLLEQRLREAVAVEKKAAAKAEEARLAWQLRRQEKEAIEMLREKKREEHAQLVAAVEQRGLGGFASTRATAMSL